MQPQCSCGRLYLVKAESTDDHCDDCFVCRGCLKRYFYCVDDSPPLGLCDDCLGIGDREDEEYDNESC